MATDLIMPRLSDQQQSAFFQTQSQQQPPPQWQQQQVLPFFAPPPPPLATPSGSLQHSQSASNSTSTRQISPLSTSGNVSPTSPKAYHTRQIRPLYMPAVLRPNEHPSKAPPASRQPKTEGGGDEEEGDRVLKSNSSFISLGSALGRLGQRSTGDSGKCVDGNWNLDMFPKPTGTPTREHWKPDHESTVCDHSTCRRQFSYFTRRHHCRRCGNIFCDAHSAHSVPLDQDANYNPRGTPARACAHCFAQFKQWKKRSSSGSGRSRANSRDDSSSGGSSLASGEDEPLSSSPTTAIGCGGGGKPTPRGGVEVAVSVPRDWNWSTF